jgi:predicted alpha/beta superfamily hydrolase
MAMRRWVAALLCSAWLACGGALAASTVRFEADLSAEIGAGRFDPQRDGVGLRGGFAPLVWDRGLPMQAIGHGRYALTVRFDAAPPAGQPIQHKFRIERPGLGADEGWEPGRNHALVLREGEQTVARQFGAAPADVVLQRTGQIDPLGTVLSRWVAPRGVQVWLPPGYAADADRRHPVLYLHDGQNVFDAAAAGAEWGVDETSQRLAQAGIIGPPIVVAIASGPDRMADYTPTSTWLTAQRLGRPQGAQVGGGAPAYARFVLDELKPLIDARYRTRPEAANTAVGGSSLGGLVSLWMALHHADRVGAALVVSPSLWWDDALALREVQASRWAGAAGAAALPQRPRLWLSMGGQEGEGALPAARQLHAALVRAGWRGRQLQYLEVPDARHDEASWAAQVEGMMRFLYVRDVARD